MGSRCACGLVIADDRLRRHLLPPLAARHARGEGMGDEGFLVYPRSGSDRGGGTLAALCVGDVLRASEYGRPDVDRGGWTRAVYPVPPQQIADEADRSFGRRAWPCPTPCEISAASTSKNICHN